MDCATGSTYSGVPGVDKHHLIIISSGFSQMRGFSWPGSFILSYKLPTLLKLELVCLTNSAWMSREVWQNVEGGLTDI
jgi:hypothetical protein